jgi:MerR family transcriptional regulator/heat shock protein HspR
MARRTPFEPPGPEAAVYVISVAAELSGLHPQTLRTYERMGLITPDRTGGGGRRYSHSGIEGVRRILDLEHRVAALKARNEELRAELEGTREALRQAMSVRRTDRGANKLPVRADPSPGQAVVVWRRSR